MTEGNPTDLRSLGEMLRAAREAQGRSVEQLSTATRISPRMLEALEADALERLGTPVYAKGFVRTVARELRLDERALVLKLETQLAAGRGGETGAGGRAATWRYEQVKVVRPVAVGRRRPTSWQLLIAIVLLLLAVLGGVWLGRRGGGARQAHSPVEAARPPESAAPTAAQDEASVPSASERRASPMESGGLRGSETASPSGTVATPPAGLAAPTSASATNPAPADPVPANAVPADPVRADPVPANAVPADPALANPAPSGSAPTPLTAQAAGGAAPQEVVVFPHRSGLASIERSGAEPAPARLHFLDLRAKGRVEIVARIDGGEPQRRVLDAGQSWKLSAREFFTLRLSDSTVCEVWMDGAQQRAVGSSVEFRVPPESAP